MESRVCVAVASSEMRWNSLFLERAQYIGVVNATLSYRIPYNSYDQRAMPHLRQYFFYIQVYFSTSSSLPLLFSHHDAGTGAEALIPVTEPTPAYALLNYASMIDEPRR